MNIKYNNKSNRIPIVVNVFIVKIADKNNKN